MRNRNRKLEKGIFAVISKLRNYLRFKNKKVPTMNENQHERRAKRRITSRGEKNKKITKILGKISRDPAAPMNSEKNI